MSSKPLVSVVTCFFNAEKFFEEAIESVFAQTYDNWELLLVDDGSTDSSTQIALQYAQKYPDKVRYFEHEGHKNRGKTTSRNLGIRHTKGEYIAFLDADDIFLPPKLEEQLAILSAQPEAAMVCGSYYLWSDWAGNSEDIRCKDSVVPLAVCQLDTLVKPPALLTLFLQNKAWSPGTCCVLIRREIIEEVGDFDESIQFLCEDRSLFAKIYLKAPIFVASKYWDRYRQHPNNSCRLATQTGQYHAFDPSPAEQAYLTWLEKYLIEQGVKDTDIWQALKKKQWPYRHVFWYKLLKGIQHLEWQMRQLIKRIGRQTLPIPIRIWLRTHIKPIA